MLGKNLIQTANMWLPCTEYVISAGLLLWISLEHLRGLQTAKISASVEKSEIYEIMASTFKYLVYFCLLHNITWAIMMLDIGQPF